jgi:hypothetical protein
LASLFDLFRAAEFALDLAGAGIFDRLDAILVTARHGILRDE